MSETIEIFNSLLQLAVDNGASDIHVKSDKPAFLRLHGHLEQVDMDPLTPQQILEFIEISVPQQHYDDWKHQGQIDYSYNLDELGLGRFRVNAFHQRSTPSIVFRHVNDTPPTFEQLNHQPKVFKELTKSMSGIVLICGPTGSGKSSTLAAFLEHINSNFDKHIITLEDPIEYTYTDKKCIINQREVGIDTPNFELGLKAILRQDPDIILIGEMRDRETFETALYAAETGHLVFSTLHAANAQQTVQRLFEFFPVEQQESMRRQIAELLKATITQQLVPTLEGEGRVPAVEIFVVDALGASVIKEGTFEKIQQVIEASEDSGSQTFNKDLFRLIKSGIISKQDGLAFSPNPKALEMNLKGIYLSSGGIVGWRDANKLVIMNSRLLIIALLGFSLNLFSVFAKPSQQSPNNTAFESRLDDDRLRLKTRAEQQQLYQLTKQNTALDLTNIGLSVHTLGSALPQVATNPQVSTEEESETEDTEPDPNRLWLLNGVLKLSGKYEPPDESSTSGLLTTESSKQKLDSPSSATLLIDGMATYKNKQREQIAAQVIVVADEAVDSGITLESLLATSRHHSTMRATTALQFTHPNPYLSSTSMVFANHSYMPQTIPSASRRNTEISSMPPVQPTTQHLNSLSSNPFIQLNPFSPAPPFAKQVDVAQAPRTQTLSLPTAHAPLFATSTEQPLADTQREKTRGNQPTRIPKAMKDELYFQRMERF